MCVCNGYKIEIFWSELWIIISTLKQFQKKKKNSSTENVKTEPSYIGKRKKFKTREKLNPT